MGINSVSSQVLFQANQYKATEKQAIPVESPVKSSADSDAGFPPGVTNRQEMSGQNMLSSQTLFAVQEAGQKAEEALQSSPRENTSGATAQNYDFSNMSRQEIADAGKQLFAEGKITLSELFRFDHPDGKLRIDTSGNRITHPADERIDFISATSQAISNMEQTGEAHRSGSHYEMMLGLLDKLYGLQG